MNGCSGPEMTGLRAAEAQRDPFIWKERNRADLKKCMIERRGGERRAQGDTGMFVRQDYMKPSKLRLHQ